MKKIYPGVFISILLFLSLSVSGQMTYQRSFDFGNDDYVNQVIPDGRGNHFYVGSTNSTGAGGYDALFTKTDASGAVLWEKQFGGSRTEYGTTFLKASDGTYVIAGRTNSFSASGQHDAFIAKVDSAGTLLWAKTYGTDSTEYAFAIMESPDSGYVIAGVTYGPPAPKISGRSSMFVVKTDINGNTQWARSLGSQFGNEQGYALSSGGSNGFLLSGYTGLNLIGMNDAVFFFMDWSGSLQLSYVFGGSSDDDIRNSILGNNGGLLAGNTRSYGGLGDLFVAKINVNGGLPSLGWFKTYGTSSDEYITSFKSINPNSFLLIGHTMAFGTNGSSFATMIDSNGVSQWTRYYDGPQDDNLMDADVLASGDLLLAGYTNSYTGVADDFYLIQANPDGTACNSHTATISDSLRVASVATLTGTEFASDTFVITTATVGMSTNTNTTVTNSICVYNGITDIAAESNIKVYPNPASSIVSVSAASIIKSIRVADNAGRLIYEKAEVNTTQTNMDVLNMAPGLYTLSVIADGGIKNIRLVIVK